MISQTYDTWLKNREKLSAAKSLLRRQADELLKSYIEKWCESRSDSDPLTGKPVFSLAFYDHTGTKTSFPQRFDSLHIVAFSDESLKFSIDPTSNDSYLLIESSMSLNELPRSSRFVEITLKPLPEWAPAGNEVLLTYKDQPNTSGQVFLEKVVNEFERKVLMRDLK